MNIQPNVGRADSIVRLVLSATLIVIGTSGMLPLFGSILCGLGAITLQATAFIGYCPLYRLVHFSTARAHA